MMEEFEKTRIKTLWEKEAAHRGGDNLSEGADISVARKRER